MLRNASVLLLLPLLLFVFVPTPAAALKCADGSESHSAAVDEVPGVPAGTQTCGKTTILNGGCDSNPYPFLEQRRGGGVQITPTSGGSDLERGINPALACRLAKLIQAFETKGCQIRISSAYRSAQQQQDMCGSGRSGCAPAGKSCHQYGLAVDITSNCMSQLRSYLGTQNPGAPGAQQFKLHFPYYGDHIQCLENIQAACSTATQGCDGSVRINPDLSTIPGVSPTSELSDAIRKAMGQQPPPPPPPPQQQSTLPPQQTLPEQTTQPTQSPTSTVQNPVTPVSDLINTNDNTNTNKSTSSPTSTIDLIEEFLDPVSDSIDIGTIVDIDLNPDTSDVTALDARKPTSTRVSATSSTYGNLNVPQTFTTNDLSKGPVAGYIVGENTFMLRLLDQMKNALLLALSYLKPFGGYTQTQIYAE